MEWSRQLSAADREAPALRAPRTGALVAPAHVLATFTIVSCAGGHSAALSSAYVGQSPRGSSSRRQRTRPSRPTTNVPGLGLSASGTRTPHAADAARPG